MPDLTDIIEQTAAEPAKAEVDGRKAEGQPLPDLIAADRYLAGKEALAGTNAAGGQKSGFRALRMAKGVSTGPV